MKYLSLIFLIITTAFAQNLWQNEVNVQTVTNISNINSFVNNKGIHIIYTSNGGVKYSLTQSNGTLIKKDRIIENEGAGCAYANLVANNSDIYTFYIKNNSINIAKSTDLGDTWVKSYQPYPLINTGYNSLSVELDYPRVHIVWSEKRDAYNNDAHYVCFDCQDALFKNHKCVSDLEPAGGDFPSVTFSLDRVSVSYIKQLWFAKTRDMFKSDNSWEVSSQLITDVMAGSMLRYQKIYSINNQLHAILKYDYLGGSKASYYFQHYYRSSDNLTWQSAGLNQYTNDNTVMISTISNNNRIHLIYLDNNEYNFVHKYLENNTWSNKVTNIVPSINMCFNSNGNDLYLIKNSGGQIVLQHYDDNPLIPINLQATESSTHHPLLTWEASNDADFNYYKVYKKITDENGWQYLSTVYSSTYQDVSESYTTFGNTHPVYYKVKTIDKNLLESDFSSILSVTVKGARVEKMVYQKENSKPVDYSLRQNFPNPFNPNCQISFSIPQSSFVQLKVYDVFGKEMQTLVDGFLQEGNYNCDFNSKNLASGVYFYTLKTGNFSSTKKMILTK